MAKPFANSGDPDQTLRSAASDLGLQCLPITLLRVSRLQWVKIHSRRANSVDPEQTTPSGAVLSGSILFVNIVEGQTV